MMKPIFHKTKRFFFIGLVVSSVLYSSCVKKTEIPSGEDKLQITDLNKLIEGTGKDGGENRLTPLYDFGLFKVSIVVVYNEMEHSQPGYPSVGMMVLNGELGVRIGEGVLPVKAGQFVSFPPLPVLSLETEKGKRVNMLLFQVPDLIHQFQ